MQILLLLELGYFKQLLTFDPKFMIFFGKEMSERSKN